MSDRTGGYTAIWKCGLPDTVLVYKTYLPCVADIRIFPIKTCVRFLTQPGLEYFEDMKKRLTILDKKSKIYYNNIG